MPALALLLTAVVVVSPLVMLMPCGGGPVVCGGGGGSEGVLAGHAKVAMPGGGLPCAASPANPGPAPPANTLEDEGEGDPPPTTPTTFPTLLPTTPPRTSIRPSTEFRRSSNRRAASRVSNAELRRFGARPSSPSPPPLLLLWLAPRPPGCTPGPISFGSISPLLPCPARSDEILRFVPAIRTGVSRVPPQQRQQ